MQEGGCVDIACTENGKNRKRAPWVLYGGKNDLIIAKMNPFWRYFILFVYFF